MMRLFALCAGLLFVLCAGTSLQAGVITSTASLDGVTKWEDFDREVLIRRNANGFELATTIQQGDYLVGAFQIERVAFPGTLKPNIALPQGGQTITGVFATKILSKVPGAGDIGFNYTLGVAEADLWTTLGIDRTNANTILTFYENNNGLPLSATAADGTLGPVGIELNTAEQGTIPGLEFGFKGIAGEFWRAFSATDDTLQAGGANGSVSYDAGLSLLVNNFLPELLILPFAHQGLLIPVDAYLSGRVDEQTNIQQALPVNTDTDFFIYTKVVPEPTSLAIFGFLSIGVLANRRRRSNS